jgi:hypothetical protein
LLQTVIVAEQPEDPMKRTWTVIGVVDVARSFKWYQTLSSPDRAPPGNGLLQKVQRCFARAGGWLTR